MERLETSLTKQPWQRGISHLCGVKTTGVTQCKQNRQAPHANRKGMAREREGWEGYEKVQFMREGRLMRIGR